MSDDKPKDPWHKSNLEDTVKARNRDQTNLLNVIGAMDSQLVHEVTKLLKEKSGEGIPDWSLIDSTPGNNKYDEKLAAKVRSKIDEVYSLDSKLHPLAGVIKKAGLERNYFNNRMVQGLYFAHMDKLKKEVGSPNYMATMKNIHSENMKAVTEQTNEHTFSDMDPKKHGKGIVDYLKDIYKFDEGIVNRERMERESVGLYQAHLSGNLDKDAIHRTFKAAKKKK